jgi:ABC-type maltose transport system permease subunit
MNLLLIVSYSWLFAVDWYEIVDADITKYHISILDTTIMTSEKIKVVRTAVFLETCADCRQFRAMHSCFTVFLIFKVLSVMLNLASLFGLLYLIRKRGFDPYDVSVLTQAGWALRVSTWLSLTGLA